MSSRLALIYFQTFPNTNNVWQTVLKIKWSEFLAIYLGQTARNVITWLKGINIIKLLINTTCFPEFQKNMLLIAVLERPLHPYIEYYH